MKNCAMGMLIPFFAPIIVASAASGQTDSARAADSLPHRYLPDITIVGRYSRTDIQQMPEVVGTSIYAGKKNALVVLDNVKGNVVSNNMRQVLAKVPGIHVWESDGSGIQVGIAARGLSPNRSWEFNVRQNGYDIAADPYGYPEAYYNPPLQAVQRMEIVRGHGSLQYGPQFGGMVNYILRNGSDLKVPFSLDVRQTVGSNGLFNSFNAVGGRKGAFHYYTFFDRRQAEGYRSNSRYFTNTGYATLTWQAREGLSLTTELTAYHMRSQQPGGLPEPFDAAEIRRSLRSRNWMDIAWMTGALIANYRFNDHARLNLKLSGMAGDRNSVGFMPAAGITVSDTVNRSTGRYSPRSLHADRYRNLSLEARYLSDWRLLSGTATLSAGLRMYSGRTDRLAADGKGSAGSDYDMRVEGGIWTRDIDFAASNAAAFAENIFRLGERLIVIPGVRYEWVSGSASGRNGFGTAGEIRLQDQYRRRGILLAGIGTEYHVGKGTEFYANISQAYRPVQFADLSAPPTTDVIDPDLRDAKGYNADLGFRGKVDEWLFFDVSAFRLLYENRVGTIVQQRTDGSFYNFRTNVGRSTSVGVETVFELNPSKRLFGESGFEWSLFLSHAFVRARYGDFRVVARNAAGVLEEKNLRDRRVENAPEQILRTGTSFGYRRLSATLQLSHTSDCHSDANNTETPNAAGTIGLIPAYTVADLTVSYRRSERFGLMAGVNNLADRRYFTRRAGGYPGPGIMPADGRSFFLTVTVRSK